MIIPPFGFFKQKFIFLSEKGIFYFTSEKASVLLTQVDFIYMRNSVSREYMVIMLYTESIYSDEEIAHFTIFMHLVKIYVVFQEPRILLTLSNWYLLFEKTFLNNLSVLVKSWIFNIIKFENTLYLYNLFHAWYPIEKRKVT